MHEEDRDPLKGAKNMEPLEKDTFFPGLFSQFSQFGLRWGTPNQDKLSLA